MEVKDSRKNSGNLRIYLPKGLEYFEEILIKIMKQSTPCLFIFVIIFGKSYQSFSRKFFLVIHSLLPTLCAYL